MLSIDQDHDSAPRAERVGDGEIDPGVAERTTYIGSSDVAALCNLDDRRNAWHVFNQKLGFEEPTPPTPQQEWGNRFEKVVAEWYEETQGVKLLPGGFVRNRDRRFLAAHPDRLIDGRRKGVEIKIVGIWSRDGWGEPGTDRVPLQYLAQVNWCMWLTGCQVWDLVPYFWELGPQVYTLRADPELQQMMVEQAVAFWRQHVETAEPPTLDGSNACAVYLRQKYPNDLGPMLESTPKFDGLAARLRDVKHEVKVRQVEKKAIENQFKDVIRDATGIQGPWGSVTWKTTRPKKAGVKPQRKLLAKFTGEDDEEDHDD